MIIELMIRNGRVVDPSTGINGLYDIAVAEGKIISIAPPGSIPDEGFAKVLDASGCLVTPGLIDLHTHVYEGVHEMGVRPDVVGIDQGVTTVADAGSAGAGNFDDFISRSVKNNATEVLAWLNIAKPGLAEGRSELADLKNLNAHEALACIERHPEVICGIKARMSGSVVKGNGIFPLSVAKAVAREAQLPVMVHIGNAPPELGGVLDLLEEGDVVTHAFHGKAGGILGPEGRLIPQAEEALDRGVRFDVGHGSSSFSFQTMKQAQQLGITPYSISTDLYLENWLRGPVYSLTMTMSKFLLLGYPIEQIIQWTTQAPAQILRRANTIGTLREGTIADISILQIVEQPVEFVDSERQVLSGSKLIQAQYIIKSGEIYPCKQ
ncbi:amidohydrolase/deacetylase family metallohydrolase [Paenibacillus frigoriresistens]|uniref:amidohydrolase/deacetylase family metallohydrolase n=1 Tax=Paenibacillus alginolyticus TaxID=59839 RepID=UPI001565E25E|nr:amidohydrolase/deacetylase family metallohydrolase [Paenibacillus frigoriresistens]NRF95848.1 amidohydrolase/deacetylase family metallohydrolase [Paenibacillus frigoriresistens]